MNYQKNKILFWRSDFYNASPEGGLFTAQYGLVRAFSKMNYENVFVTSGPLLVPDDTKTYLIEHNNLLRNLPEVPLLAYNSKVNKHLPPILNKEKPAFIYHYQSFFNYSLIEMKKKYNRPYFMQVEGVLQWVKENWGKTYMPRLLRKIEEEVWQHVDAMFCVSDIVKEQLIEYGANGDKIHVITSKADTDKFNPDIYASELKEKLNLNDEYIIGFSGTFAKWHGIELLARSIKKITTEIPNSKVLLVGDGELRGNVDRIIEESGVEKDVIITGLVKYEDVPKYLSLCNLLVSPCVPNDNGEFINSPVKLFEYLSMGKPIVASEIGQQGDVINDRTNGLLCKVNDIDDFVEKIKILHNDDNLSELISKQARSEAVKKYDWMNNAEKILSVYNEIAPNFD